MILYRINTKTKTGLPHGMVAKIARKCGVDAALVSYYLQGIPSRHKIPTATHKRLVREVNKARELYPAPKPKKEKP